MPVCGDILHNYYINPGGWRNTTRRAHKCQPLLSLGSETASQHPPCWGHIDSERKFLYCGFYLLVSNVRIQTPAGIASKIGGKMGYILAYHNHIPGRIQILQVKVLIFPVAEK